MTEIIRDANLNFLGGQDASKDPDNIAENAYWAGVNVTTQDGDLSPRWGWEQKELDFSNLGNYVLPNLEQRSYENIYLTGRMQAEIPYSVAGSYYILQVVAGIIYVINQETFEVSILPIADGSYISETHERVNWAPASKYLVIFDYPAYPVIVENLTARRADPAQDEIPISSNGVYNLNRLAISNAGNEFTFSDPVGIGFPDAPITFTEVLVPSTGFTGQFFQISTNYNNDPITAMAFLQAVDSSTGIGPNLVATQKGIWSYQTQLPRADWEGGQFGQSFVFNNGVIGPQAITNVNSDVFYMSADFQVRAASMSRAEQGKWSKVPISREVKNWLKVWDKNLAKVSQLNYFKNKILVTANPYLLDARTRNNEPTYDIAFGGFAVLETDNISNLSNNSSPVWAGLWNGIYPMQTVINNEELFIAAKQDGKNALFKATPEKSVDVIGGKERLIRSIIYTRMYNCQAPDADKNLQSLEIELNKVKGKFDLQVDYTNLVGGKFILYRTFSHEAPYRFCETIPEGPELNGLSGHSFKSLNFGSPEDPGCNEVTQDNYLNFRKIQFRFTVTGRYWEINQLILRATVESQNMQINSCGPYEPVKVSQECNNDWKVPENVLCQ